MASSRETHEAGRICRHKTEGLISGDKQPSFRGLLNARGTRVVPRYERNQKPRGRGDHDVQEGEEWEDFMWSMRITEVSLNNFGSEASAANL